VTSISLRHRIQQIFSGLSLPRPLNEANPSENSERTSHCGINAFETLMLFSLESSIHKLEGGANL
jgi:hypothetical protein